MGKKNDDELGPFLFELPPKKNKDIGTLIEQVHNPIWTKHKARLIQQYLYLFVQITHHGTYIDGFAGPQEPGEPEMWAANLVLEVQQLQHFHLFELDQAGVKNLEDLKTIYQDRDIHIYPGDFNKNIQNLLGSGQISQKEATFCLLDQRTFECKWSTVEALASYKSGHKIELFYLFPNHWLPRAFAGLSKNVEIANEWWGNETWRELIKMNGFDRMRVMVDRFIKLGYKQVVPWPIHEREEGEGHIMYYMIHASNHAEAPKLMRRAYNNIVKPESTKRQTSFLL